jgi:hypothetical protein
MYKILGADGKEYGPVSLQQIQQWVAQGRVNAATRVLPEGATEWKPASEVAELQGSLVPSQAAPGAETPPAVPGATVKKGLALTSFILGLCSYVLCLNVFTGIPAVICGHIAQSRAKRFPNQYGGSGLAIAGLVLGYLSLFFGLIVAAMLLPALAKAKERAISINCVNNMKQIGLAFKVWALDHEEQFPFNVSTNNGGTMELCVAGKDGFEANAASHFLVLSNELSTPRVLVCPADTSARAALDFSSLSAGNVSYRLRSGTNVAEINPQEILAVCPMHGHTLLVDGSVQAKGRATRRR